MVDLQRTPQWYADRLGKKTASKGADLFKKNSKGGFYASRETEVSEIIAERLTLTNRPELRAPQLDWGIINEAPAIELYQELTGNAVTKVGFINHYRLKNFGGSPDGLVGDDGAIEVKCMNTSKHMKMIMGNDLDDDHFYQMVIVMGLKNRKWCDFISYDPRLLKLGKDEALYVRRVHQDITLWSEIEKMADELEQEINSTVLKTFHGRDHVIRHYHDRWMK